MKLLITHTQTHWLKLLLLSIIFAVLHTLAYQPLVTFTFSLFFLKSLADGLVLLGLGVLLSQIIPSTNYVKLDPLQQFINYFALGILVVILWVFSSFVASYLILGSDNIDEIIDIIPMTSFIGILLYIIDIQLIHHRMVEKEISNDPDLEADVSLNKSD